MSQRSTEAIQAVDRRGSGCADSTTRELERDSNGNESLRKRHPSTALAFHSIGSGDCLPLMSRARDMTRPLGSPIRWDGVLTGPLADAIDDAEEGVH